MSNARSFPGAAALACGAVLLAALGGCGGDDDDDSSGAGTGTQAVTATRESCEAVAATVLPAQNSTLAINHVPAGTPLGGTSTATLPAHCEVVGSMDRRVGIDGRNYAIGFRLRMPDSWNGGFVFVGGGGNDGNLGTAIGPNTGPIGQQKTALDSGFAVVSTDGGHTGGSGIFALDPQARIDHAYNAYDKTAVAAKALIAKRYGKEPDQSYFIGCSGGGRQGMMFTQRFPTYFDGVIANAPAMRVSSGATIAAAWDTQAFHAIAPVVGGQKILSQAFSNADLNLVSDSILAACDAKDGAVDGMVQNYKACGYDPAPLRCPGAKTPSCLSGEQVDTLKKVFAGPRTSSGTPLYVPKVYDPGIRDAGWRSWELGTSTTATPNSNFLLLMQDALRHEFFTPPDTGFSLLNFNFDTDPARMAWYSSVYDAYRDANLTSFRNNGGKLLFTHGMADPIFSALDTVDYYERLAANNGGIEPTKAWSRLFLIPGMTHCSGGPATDQADLLGTMVEWVKNGRAPDQIAATSAPNNAYFPNRTRPLCPYPQYARYRGTGSREDAASFACVTD